MLITADDIRKHRPIAKNTADDTRVNLYITEVENIYIIPAIGAELYKDLNENPEEHTLLLEGGYYNNSKRHFAGLKAAIALLAYARFLPNNNINVTPFGVKEKIALDSAEVSDKSLFRQANEAHSTGLAYLQGCLNYLNFNSNRCGNSVNLSNKKFIAIGQ